MTGRHSYPYAGAARVVDELHDPATPTAAEILHQTPVGSLSGCEPTGIAAAPLPPRRSPVGADRVRVGAEVSPTPQQEQLPGDTSSSSTPPADLMRPTGEGVAPHSLIRRATPASFVREVDAYDDSVDIDDGDSWPDIITGIRAPRSAATHASASRSR